MRAIRNRLHAVCLRCDAEVNTIFSARPGEFKGVADQVASNSKELVAIVDKLLIMIVEVESGLVVTAWIAQKQTLCQAVAIFFEG